MQNDLHSTHESRRKDSRYKIIVIKINKMGNMAKLIYILSPFIFFFSIIKTVVDDCHFNFKIETSVHSFNI